jgi:PAS domain-containing protein
MEILWDETGRAEEEEWRTRLLAALEQAGDSVVLTDARGVILYVNTAFERASGFHRKDVIGQKPWEAAGRDRPGGGRWSTGGRTGRCSRRTRSYPPCATRRAGS